MSQIREVDRKRLVAKKRPLARVVLAGILIDQYREAMAELSQIRGEGIVEMRLVERLSDQEIAEMLGISRQQVHRLGKEALEAMFPDEDVKTFKQADKVLAPRLGAAYKGVPGLGKSGDWYGESIRRLTEAIDPDRSES